MQFRFYISQTISPIAKSVFVIRSRRNLAFATKNDYFETQVVKLCFVAFALDKKTRELLTEICFVGNKTKITFEK